jgi:hypothetical protein
MPVKRADLELGVGAFDQLQMPHLFHDRKIFAQVVKRARPAFGILGRCHTRLLQFIPSRRPPSPAIDLLSRWERIEVRGMHRLPQALTLPSPTGRG